MMDFMHNGNFKDLIVGETSQISKYLNKSIPRVSARNIPEHIFHTRWNRVYICFAEQRTAYSLDASYKEEFFRTNVDLTLKVIRKLKCNEIVYFSTVELWGKCQGPIELDVPFNFEENYYTVSKYEATKKLIDEDGIVILYPFNFNSRFRSDNFLMGKIFRSIAFKKSVQVGNLDWNRDILHARWVAEQSEIAKISKIIGSGTHFNVKKYVQDLYAIFGMNFQDYVIESQESGARKSLTYLRSNKILYTYEQLVADTVSDLHQMPS